MPAAAEAAPVETVLVDAHVHLHPQFDPAAWLDAAWSNLHGAATGIGVAGAFAPVLRLVESAGVDRFAELERLAGRAGPGRWSIGPTDESGSLIAARAPERRIVLIAGRQIAAREGVEVLSLAGRRPQVDGRPFDETLDAVLDQGALAVVPWGFGKWWFGRGALVERTVRRGPGRRFFLGDNAGRPLLSPPPALFRVARERGIWTLPGSDPLPFGSEQQKVGRYGFRLAGPLDRRRPAAWLVATLERLERQPESFGRLERLADFCRLQLAMQLRKRGRRAAA